MVFIIIGKAYETDGDDEGIDIHVMLRAPDDDTAVREALNALAEEGFLEADLDQIGTLTDVPTKSRMPRPIRARSKAKSRSSGSAEPSTLSVASPTSLPRREKPPGSLRAAF